MKARVEEVNGADRRATDQPTLFVNSCIYIALADRTKSVGGLNASRERGSAPKEQARENASWEISHMRTIALVALRWKTTLCPSLCRCDSRSNHTRAFQVRRPHRISRLLVPPWCNFTSRSILLKSAILARCRFEKESRSRNCSLQWHSVVSIQTPSLPERDF